MWNLTTMDVRVMQAHCKRHIKAWLVQILGPFTKIGKVAFDVLPSVTFSEYRAIYEIMCENILQPEKATEDGVITRRMRIGRWITRARLLEYIRLLGFTELLDWTRLLDFNEFDCTRLLD
jgi:hypothetical protein